MYHSIGAAGFGRGPRFDKRGLNISVDTFVRQLEAMHKAGWTPVNMRDALTARMDVPIGKTPVVLTFDDARGSQFHMLKSGAVDPTCAVGLLEAFHSKHPDWPLRATFYVMGRSRFNPGPFWQPKYETAKLRYLAQRGFEIANHSTSHRVLPKLDPKTLMWEMAECVRYIRAREPRAAMDTMALPYGAETQKAPKLAALKAGSEGGTAYRNRCILLAAGVPSFPPTHKKYDPWRVMRIGSEPGYVESWIRGLKPGRKLEPYVSDGDPNTVTVPDTALKQIDRLRLDGARLVVVPDPLKPPKMRRTPNVSPSPAGRH